MHHNGRQLLSSVCSLRDRAHNICAQSRRQEELTHLSKVFHSNGYPKPLVKRVLSKTPPSRSKDEDENDRSTTDTERPKVLCLPYVQGMSERIERGCQQLGVRAVFKLGHKLRQSLMRVKTTVEEEMRKGVVYEVPCGEHDQVCIGETGRNLKDRLKEYQYAVNKKNMKNRIPAHACQQQHTVDWSAAKVRFTEQHYWKRKVLEAHQQATLRTLTVAYKSVQCGYPS